MTRPTTLRQVLRTETRAVHEALHRLPEFERLAASRITRPDYGRLMQRLHGFYAAADTVLSTACRNFAEETGGAAHAPRAPALADDLAALGLVAPPAAGPPLPVPGSAAALAGALYVVDGAVIGGTALARAAARLNWAAPTIFWQWCDTSGPPLWRRTLSLLEHVDRGSDSRAAAVRSATRLFEAFGSWVAPAAEDAA